MPSLSAVTARSCAVRCASARASKPESVGILRLRQRRELRRSADRRLPGCDRSWAARRPHVPRRGPPFRLGLATVLSQARASPKMHAHAGPALPQRDGRRSVNRSLRKTGYPYPKAAPPSWSGPEPLTSEASEGRARAPLGARIAGHAFMALLVGSAVLLAVGGAPTWVERAAVIFLWVPSLSLFFTGLPFLPSFICFVYIKSSTSCASGCGVMAAIEAAAPPVDME